MSLYLQQYGVRVLLITFSTINVTRSLQTLRMDGTASVGVVLQHCNRLQIVLITVHVICQEYYFRQCTLKKLCTSTGRGSEYVSHSVF